MRILNYILIKFVKQKKKKKKKKRKSLAYLFYNVIINMYEKCKIYTIYKKYALCKICKIKNAFLESSNDKTYFYLNFILFL